MLLRALLLLLCLLPPVSAQDSTSCMECHAGIEPMHPESGLSCTGCHGGDGSARTKEGAHVTRPRVNREDERVARQDEDLAWRRFANPFDLRVAPQLCGPCHSDLVEHLRLSLHGTTAGHLSDGFYEAGILAEKGSKFSVFPVQATAPKRSETSMDRLLALPAVREGDVLNLATHFPDLARKECMQCHLYSQGRAVEGRVGFDGDYRGEGCAACHVAYALDGLSSSADRSAVRNEPGHPERHAMTGKPTTQTCTSCHYGDATIGLNFRGLSALPPGAPGGSEIPGTTAQLLNRQFYLNDPALVPPDVHHAGGMHCIDCHTLNDVMGDGQLHGSMEDAVEISCTDCHGTFTAPATLRTQRGTQHPHLSRRGDQVVLKSKVTGKEHPVTQLVHVLDPRRPEYNERAAKAMTGAHAELECYACHSSWNPNFIGFHFDRNASLSQLDLISGERTPGRVTTQEKVFATWKGFYAGKNERGAIAPYLTGFSSMGSFTNEQGERVLDQAMPVTAAGLSGLTMIHHQMHTVRSSARSCVDCHRDSGTWGMGTANFHLARQLAFVADERGIETVALDRQQLAASQPLHKFVLPDVVALALDCDPLQGHARMLYAAEGQRGVHAIRVEDPLRPQRAGFLATVEPQALLVAGSHVYLADGKGGVRVLHHDEKQGLQERARIPTQDARALALSWPWLYVADGPGGLMILDVRGAPHSLEPLAVLTLPKELHASTHFTSVAQLFQHSRPRSAREGETERASDLRTTARNLIAVVDEEIGLVTIDATEPTRPVLLSPLPRRATDRDATRVDAALADPAVEHRAVVLQSHVDLAQPQGGTRTQERDYAYLLSERRNAQNSDSYLSVMDVTEPARPRRVGRVRTGNTSEGLVLGNFYNTPFLQRLLLVPGLDGVGIADATVSAQPTQRGALAGIADAFVIALENFPLDKMLDEDGRRLKDVSHKGSRWLNRSEIERLLRLDAKDLFLTPGNGSTELLGLREFQRRDKDHSGFLEAAERNLSGEAQRQSLAEFLKPASAPGPGRSTGVASSTIAAREQRVASDGDLARLFDGTDPHAFDADEDARLSRTELQRVCFAALDLDDDGALTLDELSRQPGSLRELRFRDAQAQRSFADADANRDGRIQPQEYSLREADWTALDSNADGFVQLDVPRGSKAARRTQNAPPPREWPVRQSARHPLPLDITRERFTAQFDPDGDGVITRRELGQREDLLRIWDNNGDGLLLPIEWQQQVDLVGGLGVRVTVDGFLERWDLDGNGKVSPEELKLPPAVLVRLGLRKP